MIQIGRLLRTLAHLAPGQVWHRLRLQARRAVWERSSERVDARYRQRAARLPPARFDHPGLARVAHYRTAHREDALAEVGRDALAGRFTFLSRTLEFGAEINWFRADLDVGTRLWKTLLHEFSYAPALATAHRRDPEAGYRQRLFALQRSWSSAAPIGCPGFARDAWNARAVATRLMHWSVAGSLLRLTSDDADGAALGEAVGRHGLFLRDNLELDLRGNHLFRDTVGLVFANEVVGGVPDALRWLESQVREQVLPDGAHMERSPMYHAICLEDLLEVRLLLGDAAPAWLDDALRRMAGLLESLLLGDGDIPLFGDAWLGEVNTPHLMMACRDRVGPLPPPRQPEHHGGLVGLERGDFKAVLRAGPHGPDHILGHAHADLLAFELSSGTARVVCDTGTALYDPGPERERLRSTAAHSTVQIDGAEQIEAWDSFRVGRRGRAQVRAMRDDGPWTWVWASSDAFAWLPGRPRHDRLLAVSADAVLVLDAITGKGAHEIASRLHLAPGRYDKGTHVLALGWNATPREAPYHEHFGETLERIRLDIETTIELPWVGGWLIRCGIQESSPEVACDLRIHAGIVQLECNGGFEVSARWQLSPTDGDSGDPVELCSPDREFAT
ncbi:MAG: alginate lyase family protein [Deltaproteobacteria bacterium]|nr:alginate lyase family protein [Deltaproteobacteria bacterium]